jgi:hypothetical protein
MWKMGQQPLSRRRHDEHEGQEDHEDDQVIELFSRSCSWPSEIFVIPA